MFTVQLVNNLTADMTVTTIVTRFSQNELRTAGLWFVFEIALRPDAIR
jgi:hypothetical protein